MKTRQQIADWSTIDLDVLNKLPHVELTHGDHLQRDSGNGCAGNPPGFPTYFTRSVYSASGNDPHGKWSQVIVPPGDVPRGVTPKDWRGSWDDHRAAQDKLFRKLWKALPLDHPRTVAWINATFKHHNHCYQVPELRAQGKNWSDAMMIWPRGCLGKTPFGDLQDEKFAVEYARKTQAFDRWRDDEQAKFISDIRESNARISRLCAEIATPDNHDGTILVRHYFPEFVPTPELIAGDCKHPGNWWEVMSARPTPDRCPGQYDNDHPVNGSWCQMCGWYEESKAA